MTVQGALPLTWQERYDIDNYVVASCNEMAFEALKSVEKWNNNGTVLVGPAFSGKTHLSHIFQKWHDAFYINTANDLQKALQSDSPYLVIDGADTLLTNNPNLAETLFHLINMAHLGQKHILVTASQNPKQWAAQLPDLLSRLQSFQHVDLDTPDEAIIKGAYQKLFLDRGLVVDNKVLDYLVLRTERSFSGIQKVVETLDTLALQKAKKITIPLIQNAGIFN